MIPQNQHLAGMTLIELLIVITIMGFLSSLVVPDVRNQIERASAQEEFMRLQSELNTAAFLAFSKGGNVTVIASGSELTIFRSQLEQKRHQYSYLFFDPKQKFEYLNSGYATREKLTVTQRGRVKEIDLNRSFRGNEETS
jgi:prepilin-type N-terminal cleavage/methylation domain-containing protein